MKQAVKHVALTAIAAVVCAGAVAIVYTMQGWPEIVLSTAIPAILGLINGLFLFRLPHIIALPAKQFLKGYAISRAIKAGLNMLVFGISLAIIFGKDYNLFRPIVVYLIGYLVFMLIEIAALYTSTQRKGVKHA